MLPRETEFARKVQAYDIAVQQGHRPAAGLQELGIDNLGQRGFSGSGQPGEEQRKALSALGGVYLAQLAHYLGKAEPGRNILALRQILFQLGIGIFDVLKALRLDFRARHEFVACRDIVHGLHGHDCYV